MRYLTTCVALCALVLPAAAFGAYDFELSPRPQDFAPFREPDGGYVVDHLRAAFALPAVPVAADAYRFRFLFPADAPVEFAPQIDRIDFTVSLGDLRTNFAVHSSAGARQSTLAFDVENLSLTSAADDTVSFYDAGSFTDAVGVGVDHSVRVTPLTVTPGEPFRLRSLDVTFRIPAQFIPSDAPASPASSVVLDIGAGGFVAPGGLPTLEPLVRVAPEPGQAALALAGAVLLLRRASSP